MQSQFIHTLQVCFPSLPFNFLVHGFFFTNRSVEIGSQSVFQLLAFMSGEISLKSTSRMTLTNETQSINILAAVDTEE